MSAKVECARALSEITKWVNEKRIPCDCHYRFNRDEVILKGINIDRYDHEGGVPIAGYKKRQWVYVTCHVCGYQWALWRLINKINFVESRKQ